MREIFSIYFFFKVVKLLISVSDMEGSEAGEKRCEDSSHVEPVASPKSIHDKNDETDDIDVENDAEISAQHIEKDDSYRLKEANEVGTKFCSKLYYY